MCSKSKGNFILGIIYAIITGLFGGSILVPMKTSPIEYQGLVFVPSMGIGTGLSGFLLGGLFFLVVRVKPSFHIQTILLPGVTSGVIWNVGNICSILSTQVLGLSVACPFLQCALFFSGFWGICVFKELRGLSIIIFFCSAIVLVFGAVFLATSIVTSN